MELDLNIYNVFELLKASYKIIDFRSAIYNKDNFHQRIISVIRFSNDTKDALKKKYDQLELTRYKTQSFEIQHEILEIHKWEDKIVELYEEIEDIEIDDIDEFYYSGAGYDEFQSSFLGEFKVVFSNPKIRFFFTEEEIKRNNVINFYYTVSNKNEHHNQFNRFLNKEILILGEDNIYDVINRTIQLEGYSSQSGLFISVLFPIYMKISDLNYVEDIFSGKVKFHEVFDKTKIFFRIYSDPNYKVETLTGKEEFVILKDNTDIKEIDNEIFETSIDLDFSKYDCDPIFEIKAFWEKLPELYLLDFQRTFDTPRFQKAFEDLREEVAEENNYINELPSYQKSIPNYEKKFIKPDVKEYELPEYNEFMELINLSAYDDKFYRILPVLLRTLFENLLYDIFQTGLKDKHKSLYFLKSQNRARNFSQLIALLNILKDKDFKRFHRNSINQNTISELKEIQIFGNWTVHQFLRLVDKDFVEKWEEKVNRILKVLLVLYKKINKKYLEIIDQSTLEIIKKTLNLKNN